MSDNRLEVAVQLLENHACSFVLYKEGEEPIFDTAMGLKPIMTILRENRNGFEDCVIADKVIGKAAALMVVLGGADAVHGQVMSQTAIDVLERYQIPYTYKELVPFIENRTQTGMCPLEASVQEIENPDEAFEAIEATITWLMNQK